jgi:hypothetical protein
MFVGCEKVFLIYGENQMLKLRIIGDERDARNELNKRGFKPRSLFIYEIEEDFPPATHVLIEAEMKDCQLWFDETAQSNVGDLEAMSPGWDLKDFYDIMIGH